MLSQEQFSKLSHQEKSIKGYFIGVMLFVTAVGGLAIYTFISICLIITAILVIVGQKLFNNNVPENNILYKYISYIKQMHSNIPENYHLAILNYLRDIHHSSFGKFDETIIFSADELDQHINKFMEDANNNLRKYSILNLKN